jgi:hypothetical protein
MPIKQISKILLRTGANENLPQLDVGEIGYATDARRLYIGNDPALHSETSDGPNVTEILTEHSGATGVVGIASPTTLGAIKVGEGLTVDDFGLLSVTSPVDYPISVENGGTGATSPSTALSNLGGYSVSNPAGYINTVAIKNENGFFGTVSKNSTTAEITISTTVNGLLKGNGTSIDFAVEGTDYQGPIILTTNGSSGVSTLTGNILNIPSYSYSLPIATSSTLGGVKQGSNVTIDANGVISVAAPYSLPIATSSVLGGVKQGSNVTIDANGVISVAAPPVYELPKATSSTLGGVRIGERITTDETTGTISVSSADIKDFLNFSPFAGYLKENYIPVYGSFNFSQGSFNATNFMFVDKTGNQVFYFSTSTPVGSRNVAKAYRIKSTDSLIFDNELISATFLNVNEKVQDVLNLGTNFIVLKLTTIQKPETITRIVIAKTYGSSKWRDWTLAYDVTSLSSRTNFSLVSTTSGDRILVSDVSSDTNTVTLKVYDANLSLLRSQLLYDKVTMVNTSDTTGQGRIAPNVLPLLGYAPNNSYGFTWNSFSETFHQRFHIWYVYTTSTGASVGQGVALDISWSIPKSWIESGSGTTVNLIPIKSGTFRYNQLSDSTWDTDNGGMSQGLGGAGYSTSLVTDEYSGTIFQLFRSTWTSTDIGDVYVLPHTSGFTYKTLSINNSARYTSFTERIIDASPWSKYVYSDSVYVIDNNMYFSAGSVTYGTKIIQTTFSKTEFASKAQGQTNDTLILSNSDINLDPLANAPAVIKNNGSITNFSTTVVGTTPSYCWIVGNEPIYTINSTGATRTYTNTNIIVPSIPTTLNGKSGITVIHICWDANTITPKYYAIVKDSVGMCYLAKCTNGTWTLNTNSVFQTEIDYGKTNRGDNINQIEFSGPTLLTNSGKLLVNFGINVVGGRAFYWASIEISSDIVSTSHVSSFAETSTGSGGYTSTNGYPGGSFGYSTALGYYRAASSGNYDSMVFLSSKDVTGVKTELTELEWLTGSKPRNQIYVSTESATGLIAYVTTCPLFIGGYYTTIPTQSISLSANSINYIYVLKNDDDTTSVTVFKSDIELPSSFTRVLIAKMETDARSIISQTNYLIRQRDSLDELLNVSTGNKQTNDYLKWNGTEWVSAAVSAPPLPIATSSTLGGVIQGSNVTIDANGVISVAAPSVYELPIATSSVLGGVKQGSNVTIDANGVISVAAPSVYELPIATSSILGGVKQGSNVTIDANGVISVAAPYSLPIATSSVLGGVKQGSNVTIDANGVISVAASSVYELPIATSSTLGGVKQGSNVTIDANGVISVAASSVYELPVATDSVLGGIKIGNGLTIDSNQIVTVTKLKVVDISTDSWREARVDTAGVGTANSIACRNSNGELNAVKFNGVATSAQYADLAEKYLSDENYDYGTVVSIGGAAEITASSFRDKAIGVISKNPAYMMNSALINGIYVALKGRVPVKVIGKVNKGDRLIAHNNGYAISINAVNEIIDVIDYSNVFAIAIESSELDEVKKIEAVIL